MSDVFCLSVHASYRCQHSGACCSSGWPIPVEAPLYRRLTDAIADGSLPHPPAPSLLASPPSPRSRGEGWGEGSRSAPPSGAADALPPDTAGVLRTRANGSCVFFDGTSRLCEIQRHKDHGWLPMSCQQFPRVSLLDARGIFVTLSHYCPTAAGLLFDDTPIQLVTNPPAFPRDAEYDGLDARDTFPPLLRPGVLMDWDTLAAWDRLAFDRLDRETESVDAALRDLQAAAEHLRRWRPDEGPLADRCRLVPPQSSPFLTIERMWQRDREVRATGASRSRVIEDVDRCAELSARWVEPVWSTFTRPLCRYAAARLVANWCWYQGAGLRTVLRSMEAALAIVRVEAARQVRECGRMLDADLLRESIRQADLLLVHLASREALAQLWSAAEHEPEAADSAEDSRIG